MGSGSDQEAGVGYMRDRALVILEPVLYDRGMLKCEKGPTSLAGIESFGGAEIA